MTETPLEILVDPARVIIGCGLISFATFAVGFWLGRRRGISEGLATWRKSYRYMTPDDIKRHKEIIRSMDIETKAGERDGWQVRDKDRPIQVHSIAMLIQHATACDDDEALQAAYKIWDYAGHPTCTGAAPSPPPVPISLTPDQFEAGASQLHYEIGTTITAARRALGMAIAAINKLAPPPESRAVGVTEGDQNLMVSAIMEAMQDRDELTLAGCARRAVTKILALHNPAATSEGGK